MAKQYDVKVVVKVLRDHLMEAIDTLGMQAIEQGTPSTQAVLAVDSAMADYKNAIVNKTVTLPVLTKVADYMESRTFEPLKKPTKRSQPREVAKRERKPG